MRFLIALLLMISFVVPIFAESQQLSTDKGTLNIKIETDPENPIANEQTKIKISFINPKTNSIQEHVDYKVEATNAQKVIFGPIPLTHTAIGTGTIPMNLQDGENKIKIDVEGIVFNPIPPESATFSVFVKGASTDTSSAKPKSGCLIATAALGTELAPQVQMLREIRDNVLFKTNSGTAFMTGFDQFLLYIQSDHSGLGETESVVKGNRQGGNYSNAFYSIHYAKCSCEFRISGSRIRNWDHCFECRTLLCIACHYYCEIS